MIVHRAFISGFTLILPLNIFLKAKSHNRDLLQKLIITSSNDRVKLSKNPATIAGIIFGNIILINVTNSLAPKSLAASIIFLSKPFNLAITVTITNGKTKVT